jgi:BirA family biotin operon repressor/biotin-[acetyl-CoA-carboxylase] ligase
LIERVPETGSTNADLIARLLDRERVAEGHWLIADRQTSGRGRQGRDWFDGAGNFMGSTVVELSPHDPPAHSLALVASLALYETVLPLLPDPRSLMIKWPNDLLLNGAKLSGILMERASDAIVAGIGVNLVQAPDLPERRTIALSQVTRPPSRDAFADALAGAFSVELDRWRQNGLPPLHRRWLAAAHPLGTELSVHDSNGDVVAGDFDGLDEAGSLKLRLADGSAHVIHAGDVTLAG